MDSASSGRALALLLLAVAAAAAGTASCPAQYDASNASWPLLFGSSTSCTSGCEPRDSAWSKACRLDPDMYAIWGVCEAWQHAHAQQLVGSMRDGELLQFSPCSLHELIGNRTLWIMGDSHVKSLFYSLTCVLADLWQHSLGECAASADAALQKQMERVSLRGHPYNTPPRCLHLKGSRGRVCLVHSPMGDLYVSSDPQQGPGTLELLHDKFLAPSDILYVSFGRWHANNCEGIHPSYAIALELLGSYVQEHRVSNVFFGVAPHDHTKCAGNTSDFAVPACLPAEQGQYNLSIGYEIASMAHAALASRGISVIDVYAESLALFDGHVMPDQSIGGGRDCLHYCRPGFGEINIWGLYDALRSARLSPPPLSEDETPPHQCVTIAPMLPRPHGANVGKRPAGVFEDAWGYPLPAN